MVKHPSVIANEMLESYFLYRQKMKNYAPTSSAHKALRYASDELIDYVFDIIGFPMQSPKFDRDYLFDTDLLNPESANHHPEASDYLEFLYRELMKIREERPDLFV